MRDQPDGGFHRTPAAKSGKSASLTRAGLYPVRAVGRRCVFQPRECRLVWPGVLNESDRVLVLSASVYLSRLTGDGRLLPADHGHESRRLKCNQVVKSWAILHTGKVRRYVGGAKISRLKLINSNGRSRYFVQFTDEIFGSKVRISLKHLHRLMATDG